MTADQPDLISREEVLRHLATTREIGRDAPIVDIHVHASEIFHRGCSRAVLPYAGHRPPPAVNHVRLDRGRLLQTLGQSARNRISELMFLRSYEQAEPPDFLEQMNLAGVHTALLLPVEAQGESLEAQMAQLARFRAHSSRFKIACSVPSLVADGDLEPHIAAVKSQWDVAALKVHPNVSRIDLTTAAGIARIEAIAAAAAASRLPVIIHGGRSPILGEDPAASFARLAHLARIDWSCSDSPIIIAHLGVYGLDPEEVAADLALLNGLLARHDHVMVDLSGLPFHALWTMLPRLDLGRVLFGSDALYHPMWQAVVTLLHVLAATTHDPAAAFVRVASINPLRILRLSENLSS